MIHLVSHLFNLQSYESEFLSFHIWLYQRLKNRRPDRNFCGKKIPDRRLHLLTLWTQHDWIRKLIFNHMLFPQVKEVSDNAHVGPTWIQFCGLMRQLSGRLKVDLTVGSTFVAGLSFLFFFFKKEKGRGKTDDRLVADRTCPTSAGLSSLSFSLAYARERKASGRSNDFFIFFLKRKKRKWKRKSFVTAGETWLVIPSFLFSFSKENKKKKREESPGLVFTVGLTFGSKGRSMQRWNSLNSVLTHNV